jgi:high affinity sulfate transporter 1
MKLSSLKRFVPASQWISGYTSQIFLKDSIAGMTLAAYAIPVSMAYATLAGLPPQYGVYGYLIGGIFYALLGTGKQLAVGPTSAISLIIGVTLSTIAEGNIQHWVDLSSLTAMLMAGMSILAYVLRLNSIINFISETVLLGFKAGAAFAIALTQFPKLFGLPGGGHNSFDRIANLIRQLPDTNFAVLIFGILSIALIYFGEKFFRGKPVKITVVAIAIIIISFTGIGSLSFDTVGVIPSGLPNLHFPSFNMVDLQHTLPLAFACFLLAYIESVSAAKALAHKNGYEIDAHQELLALGAANLAASLGNGYPVSGGLSQSAVNEEAGAKTPVSLIIASLTIALCLLLLTGLLKNLPTVMLASVVLVAIRGLVDFKEFKRLYKVNKPDFIVAALAMLSVIIFGILQGVIIAALASLILLIRIVSTPHVAFLGRIPGTNRYTDIKRHPDNETLSHVLLFRVESPLLYFNISNVYQIVWSKIKSKGPKLKLVIFDLSTSAYVDSSGARLIKKLYLDLQALGISFKIAEAHSEVRDILRFEDIEHLLGHVSRKDSIHDVVINSVGDHEKMRIIKKDKKLLSSEMEAVGSLEKKKKKKK